MRKRSLIVLTNRPILPFPLWSRTGPVTVFDSKMLAKSGEFFTHEYRTRVCPYFLSTPYCAIHCFKNSITLLWLGNLKILHPSIPKKYLKTLKHPFFPSLAFWNEPAKVSAIFCFALLLLELFHLLFDIECILYSYLIRRDSPGRLLPDEFGATR